jgi:hypothetical protein
MRQMSMENLLAPFHAPEVPIGANVIPAPPLFTFYDESLTDIITQGSAQVTAPRKTSL